eukprot:127427_1
MVQVDNIELRDDNQQLHPSHVRSVIIELVCRNVQRHLKNKPNVVCRLADEDNDTSTQILHKHDNIQMDACIDNIRYRVYHPMISNEKLNKLLQDTRCIPYTLKPIRDKNEWV